MFPLNFQGNQQREGARAAAGHHQGRRRGRRLLIENKTLPGSRRKKGSIIWNLAHWIVECGHVKQYLLI